MTTDRRIVALEEHVSFAAFTAEIPEAAKEARGYPTWT